MFNICHLVAYIVQRLFGVIGIPAYALKVSILLDVEQQMGIARDLHVHHRLARRRPIRLRRPSK